ncbi:MAG: N,N-dimethylformamidase beta subunit family domain-containing protein, partial [Bacillota bacterium]
MDSYTKFNRVLFLLFTAGLIFSGSHVLQAQFGNGYAFPYTVTNGDTVNFYISSTKPTIYIQIYKLGLTEKFITQFNNIPGGEKAIPANSYEAGCSWPVSFSLPIPESWPSGVYAARFPLLNGEGQSTALFFVKEKNPGNFSKILIVVPEFTWQAYNNFGGKNVYDENSTDNKRAHKVSFLRPYFGGGYAEFRTYPYKLLKWLDKLGVKYEVATELDVHKNKGLLSNYKLVISAGHVEYYSRQQRKNLEEYVAGGGKFMSLSGNTCWWQVRIENNDSTLICYKDRTLDPLYGKADSLVTVNWFDQPLNYPENILLGASFRNAGYVNDLNHSHFRWEQGFGDYAAFNSQNWVYSNTGLKDGVEFGRDPVDPDLAVVGYEVDGALFKWNNGIPEVTGQDGTPANFRILGISPAIGQGGILKDRNATMGLYYTKTGGAVFNAATVYWVEGLAKDTIVQKITKNVIDKFLQNRFPPEITKWTPFTLQSDTVNGQPLKLNRREITVNSEDTVKFSVSTLDPYGEAVKYQWYVDSVKVSTDSTYDYISKGGGSYLVKVLSYNSKDTSSISWKLNVLGPVSDVAKNPAL